MTAYQEPKRVLIADDELHVQHVLAFRLQAEGVEVFTAEDGAEAYELAKRVKPDLVITDLLMPVLDGLELCRKLRSNPKTDVPVILLTARGHHVSIEELERSGVKGVITKPFSLREVIKLTHQLLDAAPLAK